MTPVRPYQARQELFYTRSAVGQQSSTYPLSESWMLWYIAVGSAAGGVSRYLLGGVVQERLGSTFPVSTLVINVTGSLILGFLLRWTMGSAAVTPEIRAMLATGFCGGYTTFSTYSYETAVLIEDGQYARAGLYVGLSVVLALTGTFAGFALARSALAFNEQL